MRLATFNLKDFFAPRRDDEHAVVEAKLAAVVQSLRRANADVVALQEVGSIALLERLVASAPELSYGTPVVGIEDRRGIRNVILSRLPVLWSQVHKPAGLPFPTFVEGDADPFPGRIPLRRAIVHVRVEAGALGEVDVLTAHFKSNLPAPKRDAAGVALSATTAVEVGESAVRSLVLRAAEALYLRSLVDGIFASSPDHAICVMGDLNDTLDSLPLRLVRGIDPTSKHHLGAAAESIETARRYSVLHGGGESLIDHILLSERLRRALRRFEIHNEALRNHGPHVDDTPLTADSDHALCLADLSEE